MQLFIQSNENFSMPFHKTNHVLTFLVTSILSCPKISLCLTLSHTVTGFHNPETEAFGEYCGKRRKCWSPAFSPFPTMFSAFSKTNFKLLVTFILSSAHGINLNGSKLWSSGKWLRVNQSFS